MITKDEIVINFGYEKDVEVTSGRYNSNPETPNFIYGNKYSYWTMTPHEDSDSHLWYVSSAYQKGVLEPLFCNGTNGSYAPSYSAVRPVINLKKASETTKPSDRKKSITSKEFKIGDIVEYNGISFYAIENSDKAKNTVALLKAEPLTTTEVNKYGKGYINKDTETKEAIDHNGYGYIAYYSSDTCTDYSENPIGCLLFVHMVANC